MFRTARVSTRQLLPASMLFILAFLMICLTVHFLVEDLAFISIQPDAASSTANYDELTHEDDLALPANLPARISVSRSWFVISAIIPSQDQAFFPLRHPPKI